MLAILSEGCFKKPPLCRKGFFMNRKIIVTIKDLERLKKLVSQEREFGKSRNSVELLALEKELTRAVIVDEKIGRAHV